MVIQNGILVINVRSLVALYHHINEFSNFKLFGELKVKVFTRNEEGGKLLL